MAIFIVRLVKLNNLSAILIGVEVYISMRYET